MPHDNVVAVSHEVNAVTAQRDPASRGGLTIDGDPASGHPKRGLQLDRASDAEANDPGALGGQGFPERASS